VCVLSNTHPLHMSVLELIKNDAIYAWIIDNPFIYIVSVMN